jgi:hypothetical protein
VRVDFIVGTVVLLKAGIYVLVARLGVTRYVGKAACYSREGQRRS